MSTKARETKKKVCADFRLCRRGGATLAVVPLERRWDLLDDGLCPDRA